MSAAVEITKTPTVIGSLIKYQHEAGLEALYVTGSVTNNDEGMTWQVSAGDAIALWSAGKRAQPPACQQENAWQHKKVTSSISTSLLVSAPPLQRPSGLVVNSVEGPYTNA